MVPSAAVVAGPRSCITLRSSISRARQHERTHVRLQALQPFVSGAGVFHAKYIVNFTVIGLPALHRMHRIQRHGLVGALENRWLVHVVPEAADSHSDEIAVERSPPFARGFAGK